MKKEDLEKIGLTEEQQAEVFRLNGLAIEQYKTENVELTAKIQSLETEKTNLTTDLETANNTIQEFKNMDIDAIKSKADEYKTKYEETEAKRIAELKDLELNHTLETGLLKAGAKNTKAVKALLDIEALKTSQNLDTDIEAAITGLKESDVYLFNDGDNGQVIAGGQQLPGGKAPEEMSFEEFTIAYEKGLIE